jgi:allophanate hydrolase
MARDLPGGATSLDLIRLRQGFEHGERTVSALIEEIIARLDAAGDDKVWISRAPADALRAAAAALDARFAADPAVLRQLPLFGVPFAVKDNIDAQSFETTAACPAFAYRPDSSAPAVLRLLEAGAVLIGKTNLDQFATGLVGTRSPYGVPRNPFEQRYIPGGSSSGSAVAVAKGLVSFALGTDTAGSGRVPAAFGNIVGLKPSRGVISARGVVPACRSLDCVSIFALTAADAQSIFAICAGYDEADPYARPMPAAPATFARPFRFAVPQPSDREFFGDTESPRLFEQAVSALEALGGTPVHADLAAFRAAGAMLYGGPWVAERLEASEALLRSNPEAILPVTRGIIAGGSSYRAVDAFRAQHRLAALRRETEALWRGTEFLVLPTAATIYTLAEIESDPVSRNAKLGHYANFANLLDLAAIAVPAGFRSDGLPFGITFLAPAFSDRALCELAQDYQRHVALPLGATGHSLPPSSRASMRAQSDHGLIHVAVAGAHLTGMPLNGRLVALGARYVAAARTAPVYRLYLLRQDPPRPGLVRVAEGGKAFEIEIWSMSTDAFGRFVGEVADPLTIGTLLLADGSKVKGFLCEACATAGAEDISRFGGWRNFIAATNENAKPSLSSS